jgi:hypothetical protein
MTSRSERIRKGLEKYPDLTPSELAKKLKVPKATIYTERWKLNKSNGVVAKRGRPSKEKTRPALHEERQLLAKTILEDKVEALEAEINQLKHQIVGFRAVISYLEHHVGLETSQ